MTNAGRNHWNVNWEERVPCNHIQYASFFLFPHWQETALLNTHFPWVTPGTVHTYCESISGHRVSLPKYDAFLIIEIQKWLMEYKVCMSLIFLYIIWDLVSVFLLLSVKFRKRNVSCEHNVKQNTATGRERRDKVKRVWQPEILELSEYLQANFAQPVL